MAAGKKKIALIIDANSLMHRSFHALPAFSTKDGLIVNAVYGFVSTLLKGIREFQPEYIGAAFDLPGKTFRHESYPEYKAGREKAAQELYDQFPIMKEVLVALRVPVLQKETFEADDIIGTIVHKKEKGVDYVILTSDMDSLQLVDPHVRVYRLRKGVTDFTLFDAKAVSAQYGISPDQVIDYKALRGDPSDNIPGVKGIGEKTAVDLLSTFKTLDAIYASVEKEDKHIKLAVRQKLIAHKREAYMSKDLATIYTNVPIGSSLSDLAWASYDEQKTKDLFQKLEFKSLMDRLPHASKKKDAQSSQESKPVQPQRKESGYVLVDTDEEFQRFLQMARKQKRMTIDTETTGLDPMQCKLLGISFSWKAGEAWYCNVAAHKQWLPELQKLLEAGREFVGHNIKFDIRVLQSAGIHVRRPFFDSMIAAYLVRPGLRQYNLDSIVFKEFGYSMQPIEDLIGKKGKNQLAMTDIPVDKLSWYSCEDADYTARLADALDPQLSEHGLASLFHDIEMPLVTVLAKMEHAGVAIDVPFLKIMEKDLGKNIRKLTEAIYADAGQEFNINSPSQLKEILFTKLNVSGAGLSKTKTGISTAASELEKLLGEHPIIERIMEYRELTKLQSTYVTALPEMINPQTGRLHTSYNQTVAATGRLSSSDPNLQNIPIRTELGNQIRKAFIAEKGKALVSVDYSQVELRIIASLAEDEKMIAAFAHGEDIHRRTAAYIYGIEPEAVTKEMRDSAKEVNFGVLYGMGAYGLASRKKISRERAQEFIEKYFSVYEGVFAYLQSTRVKAQEQGYVETLMGRKRYLPEIYSEMRQLRAQAERMAVNFPIQGTAADIMKKAMIAVDAALPSISGDARMIMQVHDELVFEVAKRDAQALAEKIPELMRGVANLRVPLVAEASIGSNWGEMESMETK